MPQYIFHCEECKGIKEVICGMDADAPICCSIPMSKRPTSPAIIRVKGHGYPSREKWMDNWSPSSPAFSTGSEHGEKY